MYSMFLSGKLALLFIVISAAATLSLGGPIGAPPKDDGSRKTSSGASLIIQVSRSNAAKEDRSAGVQQVGKEVSSYRCRAKRLSTLVVWLLKIPKSRLTMEQGVDDGLFDVQYTITNKAGVRDERRGLLEAVCAIADVEISKRVIEKEVWVAAVRDKKPPESKKLDSSYAITDKDGIYKSENAPVSALIDSLERAYDVLIEDETRLKGSYDISYDSRKSFDESRQDLGSNYGLVLSKEKRSVRFWVVGKHAE